MSGEAKILSDASQPEFQESLARWTDVGKKQPGAVVLPAIEDDAVKIVRTVPLLMKWYGRWHKLIETDQMGAGPLDPLRAQGWRPQRVVDDWRRWLHS